MGDNPGRLIHHLLVVLRDGALEDLADAGGAGAGTARVRKVDTGLFSRIQDCRGDLWSEERISFFSPVRIGTIRLCPLTDLVLGALDHFLAVRAHQRHLEATFTELVFFSLSRGPLNF